MPSAVRKDDMDSGHDGFPPRSVLSGSPNVFINGKPSSRVTDNMGSHNKNVPEISYGVDEEGNPVEIITMVNVTHSGTISSGSPNVFVNGLAKARIGDSLSCGGTLATGSSNVNVN